MVLLRFLPYTVVLRVHLASLSCSNYQYFIVVLQHYLRPGCSWYYLIIEGKCYSMLFQQPFVPEKGVKGWIVDLIFIAVQIDRHLSGFATKKCEMYRCVAFLFPSPALSGSSNKGISQPDQQAPLKLILRYEFEYKKRTRLNYISLDQWHWIRKNSIFINYW